MITRAPGRRFAAGAARLAVAAALGGLAGAARAAFPPTPSQAILSSAISPAALRARLDSLAAATAASAPVDAGEADYYLAQSLARGGHIDSAIAACERAASLRGNREDLLLLADLRLRREAPDDARATLRALRPALAERGGESGLSQAHLLARVAWAYFLAGRADSAAALFADLDPILGSGLEWCYRMGKTALATGDARRAFDLLAPVAVASRMQDEDVMIDLKESARRLGLPEHLEDALREQIAVVDRREQQVFERWGGRRVRFRGADGFPRVGIALPPTGSARRLGTVILMTPGDSVPSYDSLAAALQRHGLGVILLPARCSNWSVTPACPLIEAWAGREEDFERESARDVPAALRALRTVTRVDTTRYLVAGVGYSATIAALAASFDPRVRALLMVSPSPEAVDRGPTCAALAAARLPVFFQIAPEDFNSTYDVTDLLYQSCDRAASRIVEAKTAGHHAAQFRGDPKLAARFLDWLDGALKASPRRATPPAGRR